MNQVQLTGRLTRDPQLRYTPQGAPVGGFSLGVDRECTPTEGEEKRVDFFDVVVWRRLAETEANHLAKGRKVAVTGRLQQ